MTALVQRLTALGGGGGDWSLDRRQNAARSLLAPILDYPDQVRLCRALRPGGGAENVAVYGTRRSGKTEALARLFLSLMVLHDRYVLRMCTPILHTPTENILARKTDGGVVAWMKGLGLLSVATVARVGTRNTIVEISLPWGSSWVVHDIGSVRAVNKVFGFTANSYWIDEATKTPLLDLAIDQLIAPTLADSDAPVVLSYTPDEELDTLPARVAQKPEPQWQRHHMAMWRNPFYGATFAERWARICDQVIARSQVGYGLSDADVERFLGLTEAECDAISSSQESQALKLWVDGDKGKSQEGLDPQLLRNVFGRWVRYGANYVYKFHRVSPTNLYYCAMSPLWSEGGLLPVVPTGQPTAATLQARLALLPQYPIPGGSFNWQAVIGCDIGTNPDPWAATARLWSEEHPTVYELETRKAHGLDDDQMYELLIELADDVLALGLPIRRIVADLSGMRKGTQLLWDSKVKRRYPRLRDIGVWAAPKLEKLPRIKIANLDILHGRHRYVSGGVLDIEARNLRYRRDKPAEVDKHREVHVPGAGRQVPGDHALDASLDADHQIHIMHGNTPDVAAGRQLDFVREHHANMRRIR